MSRSGTMVTNLSGELAYASFRPAPLPPNPPIALDDTSLKLLLQATRHIQELNAVAQYVPDAKLFASLYVRKEALLSSQIEGTQCTLDDLLDPDVDRNTDLDVEEAVASVRALWHGLELFESMPLCNRFLRDVHEVLLSSTRGSERNPGEFRRSQNWIGAAGCTLKNARYVPPNLDDMDEALANLERYLNETPEIDALVSAALIHYQFETIHPFLDGNGRIGRMLIQFYLISQGVLTSPMLSVSYFLKRNQVEYYDRMSDVRQKGTYEQWVRFFLEALDAAAVDGVATAKALSRVHEENRALLPPPRRTQDATHRVFDHLGAHPIISINRTAKDLGLSYNTVANAVKKLVGLGILRETTNAARNRVFAYENYLAVLRPGSELVD